VVIADATRKGKRFPDSLSANVPVWCCVMNRAVAIVRTEAKVV
jgi:tRNA A64-2'-O-ribosylphosphate transferase